MKQRIVTGVTAVLIAVAVGLVVWAVLDNQGFAQDLAQQRVESILRSCTQQNARHTGTVKQLDAGIAQASKGASAAKREQLRVSRAFTVLLIDQLAPYQDCQRVLARSTSTK